MKTHVLALMLNAGIPDIAIEPDKTLHKVKDKLKLGKFFTTTIKNPGIAASSTLKNIIKNLMTRKQ